MKKIKKIINSVGLVACLGVSITSCDLDLVPLNEVVLEDFWTDTTDVNSVLYSCYQGMCENGWIEKAIVWGEVRSDNIEDGPVGSGMPTYIQDINKGALTETNNACDWGVFYTIINRCNTLLKYSKEMFESNRDPNFTPTLYRQVCAEAKGIRALNYFYLIRTFKDVPFTFTPSIDDTQDYKIPATSFEDVLDALIADIEDCKDNALYQFSSQTTSENYRLNSARITRPALYALLADMYLWRASNANADMTARQNDYRRCIELCDFVMNFKYKQYKEDADNTLRRKMDQKVLTAYGYPLLREKDFQSTTTGEAPAATNATFGTGNSWESIFELSFGLDESSVKNSSVAYMYGGYNNDSPQKFQRWVSANKNLLETPLSSSNGSYSPNSNNLFQTYTDYRSLTSFRYKNGSSYAILKYAVDMFVGSESDFGIISSTGSTNWKEGSNDAQLQVRQAYRYNTAGWIIYRLTDVMLMRAEAQIELAGMQNSAVAITAYDTNIDGASVSTSDEQYSDAFSLISAVYLRSNPDRIVTKTSAFCPRATDFTTYDQMIQLVEDERHREFLFEGKRYYDLVRRARREGNTVHYKAALNSKFSQAAQVVWLKMDNLDFMYMPYAKRQLKINPYLKQNPQYITDETTAKN